MNWHKKFSNAIALFLVVFVLAACGEPKEDKAAINTPVNPTPTGTPDPIPTTTPDPTSPIPAWFTAQSMPFNPTDTTNYSGLTDVIGPFFPLLVGDPRFALDMTTTSTSSITAKILLAFEDSAGWKGIQLDSFPNSSTYAYPNFNAMFVGDFTNSSGAVEKSMVVRVSGVVNTTGQINGAIYYRLRNSADADNNDCRTQKNQTFQCVPVAYTQTPSAEDTANCPAGTYNPYYPYYPYSWSYKYTKTAEWTTQTDCSAASGEYMDPTNAKVKVLGTFQGPFSKF